jgi:anti-sigma regulatory factor (Ser/Thr protein kinase)
MLVDAQHLLPPDADSVVLARRAVETLPLIHTRTVQVKLLVSELVRNSLEHGGLGPGDEIEIRAHLDERDTLHVEVSDPGPGPRPEAGRGVGWRTVERVADRWGVDRSGGRSCVWFELDARRS